ncbi:hypothetical protein Tco_0151163 [Tanacetum coccineum]
MMMKNQTMKMHQTMDAALNKNNQVFPQTTAISNIKLPILKKEEYDIWAMEMEHYLEYIDNDVWKERKAKNILLMAIPKEHMRRFHGMDDAKSLGTAYQTRFCVMEIKEKCKDVFKQLFGKHLQYQFRSVSKRICQIPTITTQLDVMVLIVSNEDAIIVYQDLEQNDDLDIEEMDINWQIAMIAIRMKKFIRKQEESLECTTKGDTLWEEEEKDSLYHIKKLGSKRESDGIADNG